MATTEHQQSELLEVEEHALEHLEEEGLGKEIPEIEEEPEEHAPVPVFRLALVVSFSSLAAAVMVGGVFKGISPRLWAAIGAILGIAAAAYMHRVRNSIAINLLVVAAVFGTGIVLSIPGGAFDDIVNLGAFVQDAIETGNIRRPPVEFTLGWRAIVGWLMGGLGLSAAWVAINLRRPALGLFVPMPIIAVGAISVADSAKIPSGLVSLVLVAIGLGLLSGVEMGTGEQRSLAYELRRAARALPLLVVITGLLYVMATNRWLFPAPYFDPTKDAIRPKTVPLSEVPDRVLFTVQSSITGPWRMGSLDIYKDNAWFLPPFDQNRTAEVPGDGRIDTELQPGVRATFVVRDLGGLVLPGLPDLVGLIAEGPKLAFDYRTGNIRLAEGTIQSGLKYIVTAARIPTVEELRNVTRDASRENCVDPPAGGAVRCSEFMKIPPPPPHVARLLSTAPRTSPWDTLDYLRNQLLDSVAAAGAGTPVEVPPEKVDDMLVGSKEGSPFEIVAAQAMLARWAGIPSRIGYGFDGGEKAGDVVEVRPKHGASFMEVYFPGYKWLPVIGTPRQSRNKLGGEATQSDPGVLSSDDIAVKLVVPFQIDPRTFLFERIRAILVVVLPILAGVLAVYYTWPGIRKAAIRARRRGWAQESGTHERIAVAYADWRDLATDFGYRYSSDTPLMFLGRVVEDEEHVELAWLVTRTLWGDLQGTLTEEDAGAAEELSKSLRKRLSQAHTFTLRAIASLSRLSLRYAYAPELGRVAGRMKDEALAEQAA